MIVHSVYFALHDSSERAKRHLLDACKKYLVDHPGILAFACGSLALDHVRPVNDRDFDVSLHITFVDKAAHDRYQASVSHKRFVEENRGNWKRARVFDSVVDWTLDHPM
jgi:Stress responsive A/B Barrel Domain